MTAAVSRADAPILFLDSGMGGLSVLGPVCALLPSAPIVYLADFAGLPYGEKTEIEVATRVCALLGRLSERVQPRMIVIACNTASTIALAHVRAVLEVPVVGTVPAIKPAALSSRTGVIGLLGTEATLRQRYVDRLETEFVGDKRLLRSAAPELVGMAEAHLRGEQLDPDAIDAVLKRLLDQPGGLDMDRIVLGCTHFPLIRDQLAQSARRLGLPAELEFVDGSAGIARRVEFLNGNAPWPDSPPVHHMVTTGPLAALDPYRPVLDSHGFGHRSSL